MDNSLISEKLKVIDEKLDAINTTLRNDYARKSDLQNSELLMRSEISSIGQRLSTVEKFMYGVISILGSTVFLAILRLVIQ